MKTFWIYIISNYTRTVLYIGVTNDLEQRVYEHKTGAVPGFTARYQCKYLLYFEDTPAIADAIAREKEIKKWSRLKKDELIRSVNPGLIDLSLHSR